MRSAACLSLNLLVRISQQECLSSLKLLQAVYYFSHDYNIKLSLNRWRRYHYTIPVCCPFLCKMSDVRALILAACMSLTLLGKARSSAKE